MNLLIPKNSIYIVLFLLLSFSCKEKKNTTKVTSKTNEINIDNINIPVYNFNALEPLLYTDSNKTYIVNFWAMWCAPCVKELPYIQEYADKNPDIEVLLVSMDFIKDIETKLKPFLKERNITSKVVLLDDPDANTWIDKIDPNWSGAIPFTIIFNNKTRKFYERSFESLKDLEQQITEHF
ncbi:TlpA disulfide reductase family protein [Oceanihabitans sp. 2_MG-2023]|uniref:TlpA family protein disulfide reductase n=1 Tax=Oceanihabitans sp. 2_MG-2023 TaxID=3062661 RepID=UPI0026E26B52|nr:TlpA disulfide reductase family protein [Oceanihabitans sp. 2_MG-2023]MDO6595585.1 TlpA disulfide reductase family protein [Oceanihabitans sp. 2_MG-2023]